MLKPVIDPEKLYRATFIRQYGLCCCNMALVSFRLFCKNLGHLREFFGQMVYRPPWQKISRTPMIVLQFAVDLTSAFGFNIPQPMNTSCVWLQKSWFVIKSYSCNNRTLDTLPNKNTAKISQKSCIFLGLIADTSLTCTLSIASSLQLAKVNTSM